MKKLILILSAILLSSCESKGHINKYGKSSNGVGHYKFLEKEILNTLESHHKCSGCLRIASTYEWNSRLDAVKYIITDSLGYETIYDVTIGIVFYEHETKFSDYLRLKRKKEI